MKKIGIVFTLILAITSHSFAQEVIVIKKNGKDSSDKPLMVVNGVITKNQTINAIPPSEIKSVNVLKGSNATDKYGSKGERGVVEITTKSSTKNDSSDIAVIVNGDDIMLNGEKVDANDPRLKRIKRIHVQGTPKAPARINKAFLGVITKESEEGAAIIEVNENSPADKAGLINEDIITKVNTQQISGPQDLYEAIGRYNPSDKVTIEYLRNGKKASLEVVLVKNNSSTHDYRTEFFNIDPNDMGQFQMPKMPHMDGLINNMRKPKLGISIEDLEEGTGVKIKAVTPASPAEKAGLKVGDVITTLDKQAIKEVNDLKWEYFEAGQTIRMGILRNKEQKMIEIKIPKKINSADL